MHTEPRWSHLTEEQCKLLGDPSDETFTWMLEAHRNMLAHRCLEAVVMKRFEQLETEKLALYEMAREARKCEQLANASRAALVNRAHEFVCEIRQLHDGVGPLQFCNSITKVQAAIDRFHAYLADEQ